MTASTPPRNHPSDDDTPPIEQNHLPLDGFTGTPEEIERQWFEQVYKGRGDSMRQLTWRAVLMGSLLGGLLALTNIYIGLKTGWGFGVAITACILSYSIWTTFYKLGLVKTRMTILENNCMQSAASSAGYSTGGTLVSAIAAFILINGEPIPVWTLMAWIFFLAILGVTMAIPMKRQMINVEQLRFPSGVAAAETLSALHSTGAGGLARAKALGLAGLLAALSKFGQEGIPLFAGFLHLPAWLHIPTGWSFAGKTWASRTVLFSWEPMFIAAGAITGIRVCTSMLIGGTLCWVVLCPMMLDRGAIKLSIAEPIPALAADLDFAVEPLDSRDVEYDRFKGTLKWKGIMSDEQRVKLLALSEDDGYRHAIERLYIRSAYEFAAPLAALPAEVAFVGELYGLIHYDPVRGLVGDQLIDVAQYEKLRLLSDDPAYRVSLAILYERSSLDTVSPMWASAPLPARPKDIKLPGALAEALVYNNVDHVLLWRGSMSDEEQAALLAAHDDPAYQGAVRQLRAAGGALFLPIDKLPSSMEGVVRLDPDRVALCATGAVSETMAEELQALSKDPAYGRMVAALVADSQVKRASANYRDFVSWSLWGGASCMVSSALLAFFLQWRCARWRVWVGSLRPAGDHAMRTTRSESKCRVFGSSVDSLSVVPGSLSLPSARLACLFGRARWPCSCPSSSPLSPVVFAVRRTRHRSARWARLRNSLLARSLVAI